MGDGGQTGSAEFGWRPPYAYVPGRSPRHPEHLFDAIKEDVAAHAPGRLEGSAAWRAGLAFLAEGYYWESHEVLEAVWMACPPNSAEKVLVQGIIQYANAGVKVRMERPAAAARLLVLADGLIREAFDRVGRDVSGGRILGQSRESMQGYREGLCMTSKAE